VTAAETQRPRDYGGWRRRRSIGLFGLGAAGTLAVLGVLLVLIITAAAAPAALLYAAPLALAGGVLGLGRPGGEPLAMAALRRARWRYATARDYTAYRAGGPGHAGHLPGVLAPLALVDAGDGYGGRYGLVLDRRAGLLTATLRVIPASTWLADRDVADSWVANWGGWLAGLGYLPAVRQVNVTVDTAPEPGSMLADAVAAALDPAAPLAARQILGQLAASAPAAAADVDTRVSVTFDPSAQPAPPQGLAAAAGEVSRMLHGLESSLGTCGVTVLGRASSSEIAGIVRTAFDPSSRGEIGRTLARGTCPIGWAEAGPDAAQEEPGCYRHDSGISITWAWSEAPRQTVTADVLARLVAPARFPKRVSLLYRPFGTAQAARVLESEVNAAQFREQYRRRTGRDETARDTHDQARARQAAAEEAAGAGVGLLSLYVTVTVTSDEDLPRAAAETEAAAEACRIRLRRISHGQAPGFAVTLPCGICPPDLARRFPH
jgi:hypothetical protein